MIPFIHEYGATDFRSVGLGGLSDCASCVVYEERNGEYSLTLDYPANGINAGILKTGRLIAIVRDTDGTIEPFEIYQVPRPLRGMLTVKAFHVSYGLSRYIVAPGTYSGQNANDLIANLCAGVIATGCGPFEFDASSDFGTKTLKVATPRSLKNALLGEEGSFLQKYGGDFVFSKYVVSHSAHAGETCSHPLFEGIHVQSATHETDISSAYGAVVPYWQRDDTVICYNGLCTGDSYDASKPVVTALDVSQDIDVADDATPTQAQLESAGNAYIRVPGRGAAVDRWEVELNAGIEDLHIRDYVNIALRDGTYLQSRVASVEWDCLKERYNKITLGTVRESLYKAIRKVR